MPRVRVVHTTEYRYHRPVRLLRHRLMLRPRDSHDLRLLDATLGLSPPAAQIRWAHDVQGNSVAFVDFRETRTDLLRIVSTLELQHYPTAYALPLEKAAEQFPFSYAVEEVPDLSRLMERHSPDPERQVDRWARRFLNPAGPTRTMDLLVAMTQAIKTDFTYQSRAAEGTNEPAVTLATRKGACRDLALLMMEAARALGFAARFISGYLYDEDLADSDDAAPPGDAPGGAVAGATMTGGGATHAWVSIYLPGTGWVEFDPTNGLIAGHNLIRVSVARTPEQAVPVGGGFVGSAQDFAGLKVTVDVMAGEPASRPAPVLS